MSHHKAQKNYCGDTLKENDTSQSPIWTRPITIFRMPYLRRQISLVRS